jgi:enediyne polyketide synthase
VQLFEGNGSGTPGEDEAELTALTQLRADAREAAALGSIKANIGHAKAAAGVAGLIKTVLALSTGVIPPTTGVLRPHPLLTGADAAYWLPEVPEEWPGGNRLAGVSAMGVGGVNVHLVLRNAPGRGSRYDRVLRVLPRLAPARSERPARSAPAARTGRRRRTCCTLRTGSGWPPP